MFSSKVKAIIGNRRKTSSKAAKDGPKASWEGMVSFGGINVPVSAYNATKEAPSMLSIFDKRDMKPTGMRPYNKATGLNLERDLMVKGLVLPDGRAVVIDPEQLSLAFPKTTKVFSVSATVKLADVPLMLYTRSYALQPVYGFQKGYALILSALSGTRLGALGRVVVSTTEHIAVVVPDGSMLMMHLLRGSADLTVRAAPEDLPVITPAEILQARKVLRSLTAPFSPSLAGETFSEKLAKFADMHGASDVPLKSFEDEVISEGASDADLGSVLKVAVKKLSAKSVIAPVVEPEPQARDVVVTKPGKKAKGTGKKIASRSKL